MEVFPCPLGILALRLCRSVAASKSFGHRGGDFGQLTNEGINLFAPFAVSAEAEPDGRWERPQIGFERSSRTRRRSIPRAVALDCRPKVFSRYSPRPLVRWLDPIGRVVCGCPTYEFLALGSVISAVVRPIALNISGCRKELIRNGCDCCQHILHH